VCFEFVTSKEEDALRDAALVEEEKQARMARLRDLLLSSASESETATEEDDSLVLEEVEEEDEEEEDEEGQAPRRSGCPETVTALHTSKLRWTFPIHVVPPNDTDPTDLFLDYHVARCAMEMHV
jgi:hypothetical protein